MSAPLTRVVTTVAPTIARRAVRIEAGPVCRDAIVRRTGPRRRGAGGRRSPCGGSGVSGRDVVVLIAPRLPSPADVVCARPASESSRSGGVVRGVAAGALTDGSSKGQCAGVVVAIVAG